MARNPSTSQAALPKAPQGSFVELRTAFGSGAGEESLTGADAAQRWCPRGSQKRGERLALLHPGR